MNFAPNKQPYNSAQLIYLKYNNVTYLKNYTKLTECQLFCRKRISANIKKKLNKFLKIIRAPKGPNVRIACCTFKN